jgi:N-acetylglucosamine-6-phosphate deacetylase
MERIEGRIVTPDGIVRGRLVLGAGIEAIEPDDSVTAERLLVPGFVDLHVHGGGGVDVMEGAAAVRTMARFHARHGTTTLLATTVTHERPALTAAFAGISDAMEAPAADGAEVLGVHLEGPFISAEALGAQPPFAIPPDLDLVAMLHDTAPIRVATMAPEIDPDGRLVAWFVAHGVRAQIGHTRCSYEVAKAALGQGMTGFTHLGNAMTGLHHRAPGAVGCALAHARHAEVILDFQHVAEGAVLAALRAIPGLYAITDAVAAAGMPDGSYRLGTHPIEKRGPTVRLADGTLAGSVLTMDRAFANWLALGLGPVEAVRRTSTIAAGYLGLEDRGRLVPGCRADVVALGADGQVEAVWREGRPVLPSSRA